MYLKSELFQCIIQSYLQWLQDSDYNPICEICTKSLAEGECIRLTCYRKFLIIANLHIYSMT